MGIKEPSRDWLNPGGPDRKSGPVELDRAGRAAWTSLLEAVFQAGEGQGPADQAPAGGLRPALLTDLRDLFEQVGLAGFGSMAHLGSGDGRVVLLASLFTPAVGLERDPALVASSRAQALALGLSRARFLAVDYLAADLSPYDLLFINPDQDMEPLVGRLKESYAGRLLAYGPHSAGPGLEALAEFNLKLGRARLFEL